jgi:hypothetical protein
MGEFERGLTTGVTPTDNSTSASREESDFGETLGLKSNGYFGERLRGRNLDTLGIVTISSDSASKSERDIKGGLTGASGKATTGSEKSILSPGPEDAGSARADRRGDALTSP